MTSRTRSPMGNRERRPRDQTASQKPPSPYSPPFPSPKQQVSKPWRVEDYDSGDVYSMPLRHRRRPQYRPCVSPDPNHVQQDIQPHVVLLPQDCVNQPGYGAYRGPWGDPTQPVCLGPHDDHQYAIFLKNLRTAAFKLMLPRLPVKMMTMSECLAHVQQYNRSNDT